MYAEVCFMAIGQHEYSHVVEQESAFDEAGRPAIMYFSLQNDGSSKSSMCGCKTAVMLEAAVGRRDSPVKLLRAMACGDVPMDGRLPLFGG